MAVIMRRGPGRIKSLIAQFKRGRVIARDVKRIRAKRPGAKIKGLKSLEWPLRAGRAYENIPRSAYIAAGLIPAAGAVGYAGYRRGKKNTQKVEKGLRRSARILYRKAKAFKGGYKSGRRDGIPNPLKWSGGKYSRAYRAGEGVGRDVSTVRRAMKSKPKYTAAVGVIGAGALGSSALAGRVTKKIQKGRITRTINRAKRLSRSFRPGYWARRGGNIDDITNLNLSGAEINRAAGRVKATTEDIRRYRRYALSRPIQDNARMNRNIAFLIAAPPASFFAAGYATKKLVGTGKDTKKIQKRGAFSGFNMDLIRAAMREGRAHARAAKLGWKSHKGIKNKAVYRALQASGEIAPKGDATRSYAAAARFGRRAYKKRKKIYAGAALGAVGTGLLARRAYTSRRDNLRTGFLGLKYKKGYKKGLGTSGMRKTLNPVRAYRKWRGSYTTKDIIDAAKYGWRRAKKGKVGYFGAGPRVDASQAAQFAYRNRRKALVGVGAGVLGAAGVYHGRKGSKKGIGAYDMQKGRMIEAARRRVRGVSSGLIRGVRGGLRGTRKYRPGHWARRAERYQLRGRPKAATEALRRASEARKLRAYKIGRRAVNRAIAGGAVGGVGYLYGRAGRRKNKPKPMRYGVAGMLGGLDGLVGYHLGRREKTKKGVGIGNMRKSYDEMQMEKASNVLPRVLAYARRRGVSVKEAARMLAGRARSGAQGAYGGARRGAQYSARQVRAGSSRAGELAGRARERTNLGGFKAGWKAHKTARAGYTPISRMSSAGYKARKYRRYGYAGVAGVGAAGAGARLYRRRGRTQKSLYYDDINKLNYAGAMTAMRGLKRKGRNMYQAFKEGVRGKDRIWLRGNKTYAAGQRVRSAGQYARQHPYASAAAGAGAVGLTGGYMVGRRRKTRKADYIGNLAKGRRLTAAAEWAIKHRRKIKRGAAAAAAGAAGYGAYRYGKRRGRTNKSLNSADMLKLNQLSDILRGIRGVNANIDIRKVVTPQVLDRIAELQREDSLIK